MARTTKKDCPECYINIFVVNKKNAPVLIDEQARLRKKTSRHVSMDRVINKIISEWGAWSEHQKTKE